MFNGFILKGPIPRPPAVGLMGTSWLIVSEPLKWNTSRLPEHRFDFLKNY